MRYPKDHLEPNQITIDPEFAALIPAPTADELRLLEANIIEHGILSPLVLWSQYVDGDNKVVPHKPILLDGHNRLKIVQKVAPGSGLDYFVESEMPVKHLTLANRDAAMLWIEENQLGRRNLTDDQRAMVAADVATLRSKLAQAEATAKAREAKADPTSVSVKTTKTEKTNTREDVAEEFNLSESKLRAAKKLQKENPEAAKEVRDGKKTLKQANKAHRAKKEAATLNLIATLKDGDVIVVNDNKRIFLAGVAIVDDKFVDANCGLRYYKFYRSTGNATQRGVSFLRIATPDDIAAQEKHDKEKEDAHNAHEAEFEQIEKLVEPLWQAFHPRVADGSVNSSVMVFLSLENLNIEHVRRIVAALTEPAGGAA